MDSAVRLNAAVAPRPTQIVVIGMHRSGTSVTTSVLNGLGAFVGEPEALTAPNEENPRGFFERRDARRICDALLHAAGANWWKLSGFSFDAIAKETSEQQSEAVRALVASLDEHGTWALKEPRLSVLLPFFLPYLSQPFIVFVHRDPLEVAQSLRTRNGFSTTFGLALWEAYTVYGLQSASGLPSVFLNYSDLLSDPNGSAARILAGLQSNGGGALSATDISELVDPALHRARAPDQGQEHLLTPPQRELARQLGTGAPPANVPALSETALQVLREFEADEDARAKANRKRIEKEQRKWQAEADVLRSDLATKAAELAAASSQAKVLEKAVLRAESEASELRARVEWHAARELASEVLQKEIEALRSDVTRIGTTCDTVLRRLEPAEG